MCAVGGAGSRLAAASTGVSMRVMRRGRRSLFIVCWSLGVTGKFAKSLAIVTLI